MYDDVSETRKQDNRTTVLSKKSVNTNISIYYIQYFKFHIILISVFLQIFYISIY